MPNSKIKGSLYKYKGRAMKNGKIKSPCIEYKGLKFGGFETASSTVGNSGEGL